MRGSILAVLIAITITAVAASSSAQTEATSPPPSAPPQAALYVSGSAAPITGPGTQPGCPSGSHLGTDCHGQPTCLVPSHRHRVAPAPLGAGIGMLVGGYVMTILTAYLAPINGGAAWMTCFASLGTGGCMGSYTEDALLNFQIWGDVPLLGPWVQLGYLPPGIDGGAYVLWVFEGLLELAGISTLIAGLVGEDIDEDVALPGFVLRVRPLLTASAQGLSAELRF